MEYLILLCLIFIFWFISGISVQSIEKKSRGYACYSQFDETGNRIFGYRVNKRIFIIVFVFLILFVGCRGISVGWDTVEYYSLFNKLSNLSSLKELLLYKLNGYTSQEWGFLLYTWICGKVLNFQLYLLIAATVYMIPMAIYIYRYSDDVFLGIFLFVTYGMYIFSFSTIRQSMAMGLCMIAILMEEERRIWKYVFFIIIAVFVHRTALIFIPAIFFKKIRVNKISIVSIIVTAMLFYHFRSSILQFLLGYARNTGAYIETGGTLQYLFILGILVLGVINLKKFILTNPERKRNQFLFVCICMVAVLFPVLKQNPTYFRLYYFYYMYMVVYIPNMLSSYSNQQIRWLIKVGLFILGIYMYYKQIVLTNNPLLPYHFFWNN